MSFSVFVGVAGSSGGLPSQWVLEFLEMSLSYDHSEFSVSI